MEKPNIVFQTDSEIIERAYIGNNNYLIEFDKEKSNKENYCILYFSSNDIYYPNNKVEFNKQILVKNKFEWYNTRIKKGIKHIFLRDIKKQWYLTGINADLNNVEKLLSFLKYETFGYKIIALGSSAGGFAAVLFGSLLNAELVYTFNGQFMLSDRLITSSEKIDPIIFRERNNSEVNKYFSLKSHITNSNRIFYFYSDRSDWDISQYKHISDLNIQFIPFRTNHHGIPFPKLNLPLVLNMPVNQIQKFVFRFNHPIFFSIKISGFFETIKYIGSEIYKLVSKKLLIRITKRFPKFHY
jgi:hypothetical protein